MSCTLSCGCNYLLGALNKKKKAVKVPCQLITRKYSVISDRNSKSLTISKSGYYVIVAVAQGGQLNNVYFHGKGTEYLIKYLSAGTVISYDLNADTTVQVGNQRLTATKIEGNKLEPLIALQYLGDISEKVKIVGSVGTYQRVEMLNSYADFEVNSIVPQLSDVPYYNVRDPFMFYTKATINFPHTGAYTFGSIGDDYANVYLDGLPIINYSADSSRRLLDTVVGNSGGIRTINVTQGNHDVIIWNLSDRPSEIHTGFFIKDAQGNKIAASDENTDWRYIRGDVGCIEGIVRQAVEISINTPTNPNTGLNEGTELVNPPNNVNNITGYKVINGEALRCFFDESGGSDSESGGVNKVLSGITYRLTLQPIDKNGNAVGSIITKNANFGGKVGGGQRCTIYETEYSSLSLRKLKERTFTKQEIDNFRE